jgi:hypothetical protein
MIILCGIPHTFHRKSNFLNIERWLYYTKKTEKFFPFSSKYKYLYTVSMLAPLADGFRHGAADICADTPNPAKGILTRIEIEAFHSGREKNWRLEGN